MGRAARLARLALDEVEREQYTRQLGDILRAFEKLRGLDTRGVPPTAHAVPIQNAFRTDGTRPSLTPEAALANAPAAQDGHFRVPRILDEDSATP